jgi:hypothetical protein
MRVVVKPAGAAVLVAVVGSVVFFAVGRGHQSQAASPAVVADKNGMRNADFEGAFQPVLAPPAGQKAKVSGSIAEGWQDNSDWADVTVKYLPQAAIAKSGSVCQGIHVKEIRKGRVQFVQKLHLAKGKTYQATLHVRASQATPVELSLQKAVEPYTPYQTQVATVGTDWSEVTVTGTIAGDDDTFLMLAIPKPATIWVDGATLEEGAPGKVADASSPAQSPK